MFSLFYYSISFDQEIKSKPNYNNVTSISTHTEESDLFYYLKKNFLFFQSTENSSFTMWSSVEKNTYILIRTKAIKQQLYGLSISDRYISPIGVKSSLFSITMIGHIVLFLDNNFLIIFLLLNENLYFTIEYRRQINKIVYWKITLRNWLVCYLNWFESRQK